MAEEFISTLLVDVKSKSIFFSRSLDDQVEFNVCFLSMQFNARLCPRVEKIRADKRDQRVSHEA